MCKQDGGFLVFEKDVPPKEFLWPNGRVMAGELQSARPPRSYYVETNSTVIQAEQPTIYRLEQRLFRRRDDRLLATAVTYVRQIDDLGPYSPFRNSYTCPPGGAINPMLEAVFGVEAQ
ncbi:MAG: hypothetical protein U1F51_11315 [Burkholderiales bacterium]